MSNRLWAQHVKKKSFYRRLPRWARITIIIGILSTLLAGAYGAVQVILSISSSIHVVGTGLSWTTPFIIPVQNITDPLTGYEMKELNQTGGPVFWGLKNTGSVPLSIKYAVKGLPSNITFLMLASNVNIYPQSPPWSLAPGATFTGGTFNMTIGHFDTSQAGSFTLIVYGCYPVGLC